MTKHYRKSRKSKKSRNLRKGGSDNEPFNIPDDISEIGSNEDLNLDESNMSDLDLDLDNSNITDTETVTENSLNLSDFDNMSQGQDPMTLSELNVSQPSSQNTTIEDISGGAKRQKGKRKTIQKRKGKKHRKSMKKGKRGGRNLGSNCNDPNFSIYNTNMLKLFPYLPNKPN